MSGRRIDVLHIGSASRDLTPDDPRGWRLGGGVTYAALTTARLGLRTAAYIGVDEAAAGAHELDLLAAAGVDLTLARLPESPVFDNQERPGGRVQVCHVVGTPLRVPVVPASWARARAWSLVPVAGEVGDDWATAIPDDALVAVGWQGFLRELAEGREVGRRAPGPSAVVASVLQPAIVGRSRARHRPDLRFAAAAGSLAVERPGLAGVPDRAAVLIRRARERVRRVVIPSEVSQVGTGGLDPD